MRRFTHRTRSDVAICQNVFAFAITHSRGQTFLAGTLCRHYSVNRDASPESRGRVRDRIFEHYRVSSKGFLILYLPSTFGSYNFSNSPILGKRQSE
jgi:hypothetical protein